MIPFWYFPTYHIGPIVLQTWGTFVGLGILVAIFLSRKRLLACGLKQHQIWDFAFWVVLAAFLGARLGHVFFYDWGFYREHLGEIIKVWHGGYSSFGGFAGGALAGLAFLRHGIRERAALAYTDAALFGLPLGWAIGRIGCFLIHDHPGTLTHFVLGVRYPDGVRHDLGLYDLLFALAIAIGLFVFQKKLSRRPGAITSFVVVSYGVGRFFLDFLRIVDVRYFGLTPAQYGSLCLMVIGMWILCKRKRVI